MRTAVFDLETFSFYADSGIVLCACIKEYGSSKITTIRADQFSTWKKERSNNKPVIEAIVKELDKYDILVAHNGQYFDKRWLNTACLEYHLFPVCRSKKFIDPVLISRKHLRMGRNSLAALLDHFDIPVKKTPIILKYWIKAVMDGNQKCMDDIVRHCRQDILALELLYDRVRPLVDKIDNRGSAF